MLSVALLRHARKSECGTAQPCSKHLDEQVDRWQAHRSFLKLFWNLLPTYQQTDQPTNLSLDASLPKHKKNIILAQKLAELEQFKDKGNLWKFSFENLWLFSHIQIFGGRKGYRIAFLDKRKNQRPLSRWYLADWFLYFSDLFQLL